MATPSSGDGLSFANIYEENPSAEISEYLSNPLLTPESGEKYKSKKILVAGAKEVRKSTILKADPESPIHSARFVSQQKADESLDGGKEDADEVDEERNGEFSDRLEEEGEEEDEGAAEGQQRDEDPHKKEHVEGAETINQTLRFLALGDSYTVGEGLHVTKSFPNEIARLLTEQRQQEKDVHQEKEKQQEKEKRHHHQRRPYRAVSINVVAKTGWTTDELLKAMSESDACEASCRYNLVTLLIGVNNQYRGRSSSEYATDFEVLLKKAIEFADGQPKRVVVLSIPDWGITPFAKDRNKFFISGQIDEFNAINLALAKRYRAHYVNVTPWTREAETLPGLLADDGLHPSGKEYTRWAGAVVKIVHDYEEKIRKQARESDPVSDCVLDFGKFIQSLLFWA